MFWGNLVNSAATVLALIQFSAAHMRGHALAWRKTEHIYPLPQLREHDRFASGDRAIASAGPS